MRQTDLARAALLAPQALHVPLRQRLRVYAFWISLLGLFVWLTASLDVTPGALEKGGRSLQRILGAMMHPSDGGMAHRVFTGLLQTAGMAFLATVLAVVFGLPLGVICARSVVKSAPLHFALRRFLDVFRGIPALIWALILVSALGLGPMAGVLALMCADIPNFAKLCAEAIENINDRPSEAVRATGASDILALRFGAWPQVAPVLASLGLYVLEANFRNAVVLGTVGAGGIGFELDERMRVFAFDQVAYILILYIICVMALDHVSAALRRRLL